MLATAICGSGCGNDSLTNIEQTTQQITQQTTVAETTTEKETETSTVAKDDNNANVFTEDMWKDIQDIPFVATNYYSENKAVVVNGKVMARGKSTDIGLVKDLVNEKSVGYYVITGDSRDNRNCIVYHADGSEWFDCGKKNVTGIIGDYIILSEGDMMFGDALLEAVNLDTYKTNDILDGYRMIASKDGKCFIANSYERSGEKPPIMFDSNLEIIKSFDGYDDMYYGGLNNDYYAVHSYNGINNDFIYDAKEDKVLPYEAISILENGYIEFKHSDDDLYDVMDTDGNIIEKDTDKIYSIYTENFKVYRNVNGEYEVDTPSYQMLSDRYMSCGEIGDGYYCVSEDEQGVKMFDAKGNFVTEERVRDDSYNGYSAYVYGDKNLILMCLGERHCMYNAKFEKKDIEISGEYYSVYMGKVSGKDSQVRYTLNYYGKTKDGMTNIITDTLYDINGNMVSEKYNNIYASNSIDGIYSVKKGFVYGLVDGDGNWLWKESIFNAVDDDNVEPWSWY